MAVEVGIKQRRNERLSLITGIESKINLDMHAIHTTATVGANRGLIRGS